VWALLRHPEQKAELTADWSLVGSAVEEILRFHSPIQMSKPRFATQDAEFHGAELRRGEYVVPFLAAANSDPAEFADAERFDIHRHPNPHLSFGTGPHVCLGLKLAREETQVALRRLFTRFPALRLAVPADQLQWTGRIGTRSLRRLPVTW
jgi:cytochrome P450